MGYPESLLVRLKTSDGLELQGLLFEPRGAGGAIVIHVHGWTGNFYENLFLDNIAKELNSRGISFLTFNNRGAGHIQEFLARKKDSLKCVKIGGSLERFEDCILDINSSVSFARKRGYRKIILQGHSTGAQKSAFYIIRKGAADMAGLVLLEPTDDPWVMKNLLGKKYSRLLRLAKDNVESGKPSTPIPEKYFPYGFGIISSARFLSMSQPTTNEEKLFSYSGNLSEIRRIKVPIFVVFGSNTEWQKNYLKAIGRMKSAAIDCEAKVIRGANHLFSGHEGALGRAVAAWAMKTAEKPER